VAGASGVRTAGVWGAGLRFMAVSSHIAGKGEEGRCARSLRPGRKGA
jgi:hypothetical protein